MKLDMPGISWVPFNVFLFLKFPGVCPTDPDMAFGSNERTALSLTSSHLGNTQTLPHSAPKGDGGIKNPWICELFLLDKQKNETR